MSHISQAQAIIMRNIDRIPGYKRWTGSNVFVLCPNPQHRERTPSCSIYIGTDGKAPIGYAYCFGCNFRGPWNRVADTLKLDRVTEEQTLQTGMHTLNVDRVRTELLDSVSWESLLSQFGLRGAFDWQPDIDWRGIKAKTLIKAKAQFSYDDRQSSMVVVVPVLIDGELVGAVKCSELSTAQLKYVTSEGEWVKSKGLMCYDLAMWVLRKTGGDCIALTEGTRDALRLNQKGIPAIAILGVKNWGRKKLNALLASGVRKYGLVFDSDDAGILCSNRVKASMKDVCEVKIIKTAEWAERDGLDKLDPGNMKPHHIRRLRKELKWD